MRWFALKIAFGTAVALAVSAHAQPAEPPLPQTISPASEGQEAPPVPETAPAAKSQDTGTPSTPQPDSLQVTGSSVPPAVAALPSEPTDAVPPKQRLPRLARPSSQIKLETTSTKPPSHRCFVRDVMAFYDRTHVRCYNRTKGTLQYFAVDTSQPVAETVLTKAWRSMRSGRPLTITYAPTAELNPSNCAASNCRRLLDALN